MNGRIVIHTDDAELYLLLKHILALEGFAAENTSRLSELLSCVHQLPPLAFIIDCSNLDMNICTLSDRIRVAAKLPVTIVSLANPANGEHGSRPVPANVDYVIQRPFEPERLLAFLRNLRAELTTLARPKSPMILRYADVEMSLNRLRVERRGQPVRLSALQFRLLACLMRAPDVVHTRDDLIAAAWPPDVEVEPRTVDIHIGHIRRAMMRAGPDVIRTVRSVGYALYMPSH